MNNGNDQELLKALDHYKNIALTNEDVMRLVKDKANIILYSELYKINNIDELLEPHGAFFLLYEAKKHYGHWVSVIRTNQNTIEYFDSYGGFIDHPLSWINPAFKKKSHQDYPYLTKLFYESKYKNLDYNQFRFQKKGGDVKTCGRWAALRILLKDMPLKDFNKLLGGSLSDDMATIITSI